MKILLKEQRKKARISQARLSALSGVPQQTISSIESGARKSPTIEPLFRISKVLGCSVDDLIGEEERKDGKGA